MTLFGFFNFFILVRTISKTDLGIWSLFLVFTTGFELAKNALLRNAHIRFLIAHKDRKTRNSIGSSSLLINALLGIAAIILISGLKQLTGMGYYHALFYLLQLYIPGLLLQVLFSHLETAQQANFDFKGIFAGNITRQMVFFSLLVGHILIKHTISLENLVLIQLTALACGTLVLGFFSKRYITMEFQPHLKWFKKILHFGRFTFGTGIIVGLYNSLDQLMIAIFFPASGYIASYATAVRINGLVDLPSYTVAEILFPSLSEAHLSNQKARSLYLFRRSMGILIFFSLPIVVILLLFSNQIIELIAGNRYKEAALLLRIYMCTALLRPIQNQAANLFVAMGKPAISLKANLACLFLNILLNYYFLTTIGFAGAAIGSTATVIIGLSWWLYFLKQQTGYGFKVMFAIGKKTFRNQLHTLYQLFNIPVKGRFL